MKLTYRIITALAVLAAPQLRAADTPKTDPPPAEAAPKEPVKPYKPDICMVSGEKLGTMGKPVVFVYQGQEIKLCCTRCRKDFNKDPAKYLKKLEQQK